jgi:hypothetical protein
VSAITVPARRGGPRRGRRPALAALVVGLAYAGVSMYWGAGGTWLLDTVGRSLTGGGAVAVAAVWAAAGLKVTAAVLPVLAVGRPGRAGAPGPAGSSGFSGSAGSSAPGGLRPGDRPGSRRRLLRFLAWAEAVILTLYGLVLTAAGLLVQSGLVRAGAGADHRALAWHAYLWDPWFLLWGLLVTAALVASRRPAAAFPGADPAAG